MNTQPFPPTTALAIPTPGWRLFFQSIFPLYLFMGVALVGLRKRLQAAGELPIQSDKGITP